MTQVQYTVEPQGRPLAVMVSIATLEQLLEDVLQINREMGKGGAACDISNRAYPPIKRSLDALRAALANAEPTGWIAAKDRMPPPQVRVLGFEPQYNIVDVDMWFGPDFNWGYSYWMPLPAAPKDTL